MEGFDVNYFGAFVAGIVSFLSPCVLPLVPGYVSYVAGQSLGELKVSGLSRARLSALPGSRLAPVHRR